MSPLTSYGVQRRLRSQSMALAHFYPPIIIKNNGTKTKDIKQHECTLILGKGFEISTKIGKNFEKRAKIHLTSSPHLQFFEIIHCNLNGTKAAIEGLMLFLFSGFLQGAAITRKIWANPKKSDQTLESLPASKE